MIGELIKAISKHQSLGEDDIAEIKKVFHPISVSKHTVLHEEGKVPGQLYFIVKGCMRLFFSDTKGNEITSFLASENEFITTFLAFINQEHAKESSACVTDCELLMVSHAEMKALIDKSEGFKNFSLTIFEHAIAVTKERADDFATLTAQKRYLKLMEMRPQLIRDVPLQYLASYLGIQPESLSRIRRNCIS